MLTIVSSSYHSLHLSSQYSWRACVYMFHAQQDYQDVFLSNLCAFLECSAHSINIDGRGCSRLWCGMERWKDSTCFSISLVLADTCELCFLLSPFGKKTLPLGTVIVCFIAWSLFALYPRVIRKNFLQNSMRIFSFDGRKYWIVLSLP